MATEWTIETLKEHFESELKTLSDKCREDKTAWEREFAARDKALDLKAIEYKEHFSALNGEAARIQAVLAVSVTKEAFDTKMGDLDSWKRTRESNESKFLLAEIFNTYKGTTQEALQLEHGRREGVAGSRAAFQMSVGQIAAMIVAAATVASMIIGLIAFLATRNPAPSSPQVIYVPPAIAPIAPVAPVAPVLPIAPGK